ncbi:hexokinase I [Scheffersomyces xylosifermentans]|uniref:hexokinase I n=1 Tax=Scheffersomyces xylosifermentans TaxID=1304137 RepID=UPI00315CDF42
MFKTAIKVMIHPTASSQNAVSSAESEAIILSSGLSELKGAATIATTTAPIAINGSVNPDNDFIDMLSSASPGSSDSSPDSSIASENNSILTSVVNDFTHEITSQNFHQQTDELIHDFNEALLDNSKITMLPNYNISPSGNESGEFLCIDLGGSTLRIAIIKIDPPSLEAEEDRSSRINIISENQWTIDNNFKILDYNFFKFIGAKINEILQTQQLIDVHNQIKTGITWSFPLKTTSYNNGKIVHVSKGYTIHPEIYNQDLKSILESVLMKEFSLNIDIKSILNDSLAVYSAGAFLDKYMKLALVLGTGFNMCCSFPSSEKIHSDKILKDHDQILFNTELSLFGQGLVKSIATKYDTLIDEHFGSFDYQFKPYMTIDPVSESLFQPNELMTSGRYLPELTRLVLVDLIEAKEIFVNVLDTETILTHAYDGFGGELMCFIHESSDFDAIKTKLCTQYGWSEPEVNLADIIALKKVVQCIIERASFIVAVSIVSFIKLLQQHNNNAKFSSTHINIGYVGSVLKHFNEYRNLVKQYVNENEDIKKLGLEVDFKLIENSSIIGAAIGAAYYS